MDDGLGLALAGVALALLARVQARASRLERALARRGGGRGASRGAGFETAATWLLAVAACVWLWADLAWRLWRGGG